MKSIWPIRTLAEVCQIKPPKAEARRKLSGTDLVSFVPMEYLGIDQKILIPIQEKPLAEVAGSYTYFADDDVLLAKITPCFENGKLGIAANLTNGIGFGSSEYLVFRPDKSVDKEWLYYHLSRESFRMEGAARMSGAVGHKRVSKEFIELYPIPIPPLPEQKRIVGILDEAFDGIATAKSNAEKNLQNACALFESHLNDVFTQRGEGWVEIKLGDVCEVKDGTHDSPKYVTDGIPFVTQKNVRDDGLSFANTKFITQEDHDNFYRRSNVAHGDILISMIGANRGMACIVDDERIFSIKNVGLVKKNGNVNQQFLLYFLKSPQAANYVRSGSKGGAQEFIGLTELRNFPVHFPSLSRQNVIAAEFETLSAETQRLESIYRHKLASLDELKKALLNQAFTGQL
jgi:type I restriction enzyme S subunit